MRFESVYSISANKIEFQRYPFFFSSLQTNKLLTRDRINAIDLNSFPQSLIIDNHEIVFVNHDDKQSLASFAHNNTIPLSRHVDTWSMLTRNYLDNQVDEQTIEAQNQKLAAIGIDQAAFNRINKMLRYTLTGSTEWVYLGLWDVLAMKQYRNPFYRFYGKRYYWELMRIALQGSAYTMR